MLPLLGLVKPPAQYPLFRHAMVLASHVVYGLTVEAGSVGAAWMPSVVTSLAGWSVDSCH